MTAVPHQRCCPTHADWPQLTQHMVERFPDVPLEEIVGIINRTRQAEAAFGLPEAEHLATGEIIIRHQLMQLTGSDRPPSHIDQRTGHDCLGAGDPD